MQSRIVTICAMIFIATASFATIPGERPASNTTIAAYEWMKSPGGTWEGKVNGVTRWYKLDKKGGLWQSTDGKKWVVSKEGTWPDKEGRWLKIHDKKLVWSTDGKEWSEVPEWKWEGSDGKWYKFDKDWTLWVN